MKSNTVSWVTAAVVVLGLGVGTTLRSQTPTPTKFSGFINDYTPATGVGGPWEMHGKWSLKVHPDTGTADFSVVMTMEHPDSWIALNPGVPPATPNVDNPAARSAHTHHITMTNATVSSDTSSCPVDSPATTGRFVVTGQTTITGNGNPAPFEAKGPSTLQVCITGGTEVTYSNVTLMFINTPPITSPAVGHFGSQPIHGVVRVARGSDDDDHDRR
jgi:uncharacterized Zn-binding protein involved in type VI secretion